MWKCPKCGLLQRIDYRCRRCGKKFPQVDAQKIKKLRKFREINKPKKKGK